jgi:hypothetical protein
MENTITVALFEEGGLPAFSAVALFVIDGEFVNLIFHHPDSIPKNSGTRECTSI